MKNIIRTILALFAGLTLVVGLAACGYSDEYTERKSKQSEVTLDNSLGIKAQQERLQREDDPSAIRYVYLIDMGKIFGYYTINGGVYGADTQLAPEQEIICRTTAESCQAVDSAKDNGTFGSESGGGVFFITTEGILIETNLKYIQQEQPLPIDVPRFTS